MGGVGGRSYVGVREKEGWREWRRGGKKGGLMIGSPPPSSHRAPRFVSNQEAKMYNCICIHMNLSNTDMILLCHMSEAIMRLPLSFFSPC